MGGEQKTFAWWPLESKAPTDAELLASSLANAERAKGLADAARAELERTPGGDPALLDEIHTRFDRYMAEWRQWRQYARDYRARLELTEERQSAWDELGGVR